MRSLRAIRVDLAERGAAPTIVALLAFMAVMAALAVAHQLLPGARDALVASVTAGWPQELARPVANLMTRGVLSPAFWFLLAGLLVLEALWPARREQRVLSRALVGDYFWFLAQLSLIAVIAGAYSRLLEAALAAWPASLRWPLLASAPIAVRLTVIALVVDFLEWAQHRLKHAVPLLWRFHAIHHSQTHMNPLTDARFHVVEALVSATIMALPALVFGITIDEAVLYVTLRAWYTRFVHSNVRATLGPLRYVLVTPQSHRVHHSIELTHRDRNFGVLLSVWDRLFGTQHADETSYPATGIDEAGFPHEASWRGVLTLHTFARQLWQPFRATFSRSR